MKFEETSIPGCFLIDTDIKKDARGHFVKTFHSPLFETQGLNVEFKESFYTLSKKNVLRGFHFQVPPSDHDKLVYCASGEILDVVLDIRKNSPAFGKAVTAVLSSENGRQFFIPKGLAHAFFTQSEQAVVIYNTTHPYSEQHDRGLHWKSSPVLWPAANPIVSNRDNAFPLLKDFKSPFEFPTS